MGQKWGISSTTTEISHIPRLGSLTSTSISSTNSFSKKLSYCLLTFCKICTVLCHFNHPPNYGTRVLLLEKLARLVHFCLGICDFCISISSSVPRNREDGQNVCLKNTSTRKSYQTLKTRVKQKWRILFLSFIRYIRDLVSLNNLHFPLK